MPVADRLPLSLEDLDAISWALSYYQSDMSNIARRYEERARDLDAIRESAQARTHKVEAEQAKAEREKAQALQAKINDIRDTIRFGSF